MMTTKNETVETIEEEERKPNIIGQILGVIIGLALIGVALNVMFWLGSIAFWAIIAIIAS